MEKDFKGLSQKIFDQFKRPEIQEQYGVPGHEPGDIRTCMVPMKDGISLNTTVMLPKNKGEENQWPAILIRNPYIALADSSLYRFYNLYGYAVVYQEVRGKGKSEGDFMAWDNERSDGIDTVRWIQSQPWYNGELYLVGSSYTAFVHMTMLEDIMPDVKAAVLRVFTPDFRSALYENGVWHLDMITPWIINTEYDFKEDRLFVDKYSQALDIRPFEQAIDQVMGKSYPWHQQMIASDDPDSGFWADSLWGRLRSLPEKINIPVLLIDGWYDPFCPGLLDMWEKIPENSRKDCAMIIGPWVHDCVIQEGCEFSMPHGEILGEDGSLGFLDWLNHVRFGRRPNLSVLGKIRYYIMGKDAWESVESFEVDKVFGSRQSECRPLRFYLSENRLTETPPSPGKLSYDYDPDRPGSFWGGEYYNNFMPGGIMHQPKPFKRKSVLNFISESFEKDTEISGYMELYLKVASDCEDTVFIARIDKVDEDGKAWNIRECASLMSRGQAQKASSAEEKNMWRLHLRFWPGPWIIRAGERLRLDITSSNYPAYLPFGNTKETWSKQADLKKAHNTVFAGPDTYLVIQSLS